jgi:anti-sigma regulatory factor (Ser/Thr protein kinase)
LSGDTALLVSELSTNAILHGRARGRLFRVRLTLTETALRIAVSDARGERLPSPRAAVPTDQFGRGLCIVRMLAARWGVVERVVGKTVWCVLDVAR